MELDQLVKGYEEQQKTSKEEEVDTEVSKAGVVIIDADEKQGNSGRRNSTMRKLRKDGKEAECMNREWETWETQTRS